MFNASRQGMGAWAHHPVHRTLLTLVAAHFAAGCDSLPTDPAALVDAPTELAAVQQVWGDLPSSLTLEADALAALDGNVLAGEVAASLFEAADLAAETDLVLSTALDAARLADAADTLASKALLASLGAPAAGDVLTRVDGALGTLQTRLGAQTSPETRARLAEASDALASARAAHATRDSGGAALHAGRAADALRWLDPEANARGAVAAANRFLTRALTLAGDTPEPPIARALAAAGLSCRTAERALEAYRWRIAVQEASRCARLARAVIVRLSGGIDPELLAERAEEAVANAAALLDRAADKAGVAPEPRVAALLIEAEGLLGRARLALAEERFRAAIGLAIESSGRSHRVLRYLQLADPTPYQLRAETSVEVAGYLSARVEARIDADTPAAIVLAAARTNGMLAQAQAALAGGDYPTAWRLARSAITIYMRILNALA